MEWLKNKRTNKGLKQYEVAKKCGISWQLYSHIENGRRNVTVKNAKKIAKILGFDWTLFYSDKSAE